MIPLSEVKFFQGFGESSLGCINIIVYHKSDKLIDYYFNMISKYQKTSFYKDLVRESVFLLKHISPTHQLPKTATIIQIIHFTCSTAKNKKKILFHPPYLFVCFPSSFSPPPTNPHANTTIHTNRKTKKNTPNHMTAEAVAPLRF